MSTSTPSARRRTTSSTSAFQQPDKAKAAALPTADASHAPAPAEPKQQAAPKSVRRDRAADLGDHRSPDEGRGQRKPRHARGTETPRPSCRRRPTAAGAQAGQDRRMPSPRRPPDQPAHAPEPQGQPSLRLRSREARDACAGGRSSEAGNAGACRRGAEVRRAPPKMASTAQATDQAEPAMKPDAGPATKSEAKPAAKPSGERVKVEARRDSDGLRLTFSFPP